MRKVAVIIIFILIFLIVLFGFLLVPKVMEKVENDRLTSEIKMVDNYINHDKGNINDIRNYIKKKVTTGDKVIIEDAIDNYLTDVIDSYESIKGLDDSFSNYSFNIDFSKDDIESIMNKINDNKEIVLKNKNVIMELNNKNYLVSNDDNIIKQYLSIMYKLDVNKIIDKINYLEKIYDEKYSIYEYLNNNKEYYNLDNGIIFLKRSKYNEFNDTFSNMNIDINYQLINDTDGPVIRANNITIIQGDYLSISDKVSCYDEVDDDVVCDINGSYNSENVGTYTINISAKDSSGNISSKDINVIVKEKAAYSLPYVIEVIRNQSTTIVYGQDDKGEYTKIVGVFPCSPGAGTNTPVGTFYSRKGYPWGSLFGGVYGQYSTIITGHVLFHSVPYYSMNKGDLVTKYYNRLGSKDSLGCVRLTVRDAKWIYDNCPSGTMIKIYDGDLPSGVSKPEAQKIDENDPRKGWDPTDPDPANPWNQ